MDNIFPLGSPISLSYTGVALTAVASVCMPVTVQQMRSQEKSIYLKDYYQYIEPIRVDFFSNVESKINSFKHLSNNWDGFGADVPDDKVINNSIKFASNLPDAIRSEINPESVVATPYGTIVFDIEHNEDLISIEIGEKNIGFFSDFSDSDNISLDGVLFNPNNLPIELVSAFSKLYLQSN
ncbi:MAG TPA: hypothetical protein VGE25_05535 [Sediminibacterium sp.]